MQPILIGYFPKKTARRPDWLEVAHVEEICSASHCISVGPEKWIDAWKHNDFDLYDSPEVAASMVGPEESGVEIYAFAQYPVRVADKVVQEAPISAPKVLPLTDEFEFLGYDAVSRSVCAGFECSPLSCNYGARSMKVNMHCLFETLDEALAGAVEFSKGNWEPGPYYVVGVYRQRP